MAFTFHFSMLALDFWLRTLFLHSRQKIPDRADGGLVFYKA